MNDFERQEKLYDLLGDRIIFGLGKEEERELENLQNIFPQWRNDETFAMTVAAISLTAVSLDEKMPVHLESKILADSKKWAVEKEESSLRPKNVVENAAGTGFFERLFNLNWLGWAVAGAACIALAVNVWLIKPQQPTVVQIPPQTMPSIAPLTPTQQRERLVASAKDVVTTNWTDFDPKTPRGVTGDVVWSSAEQKGFVRFRGLPVNDKNAETYQIWIFDKAQKNPVSGGVFDANEAGEIVIPIDSAIRVQTPTMFGITAEKPGGVMVSDLKKVMAVAKIET